MTTSTESEPAHKATQREFQQLVRWYSPYLKGSGKALAWVLVGTVVVLATQALIPLQVESILHEGVWDPTGLLQLGGMVVLLLVIGHFTHLGSHNIGLASAVRLRERLFARVLASPGQFMRTMGRNSVVTRHTTDVDHVADTFVDTVSSGLPGIARLLISLVFLWTLVPGAAYTMAIASCLFLLVRSRVGRGLLAAYSDRLAAETTMGQSVDETVTSAKALTGLQLLPWVGRRFSRATEHLHHTEHAEGIKVVQLITGAHAAGMIGLLAIVVFATIGGHENMAAAAAALLYVEGVVKGLESLPPWVRSIHLAVVSQRRIDEILTAPTNTPDVQELARTDARLREVSNALAASSARVAGLVTPVDLDPDAVLATLGRLGGAYHVPAETLSIDASATEYLRAANPDITDAEIVRLLKAVKLSRLADDPTIDLGPSGNLLNTTERQRLGLAVALARKPDILGLGPLVALADSDTAAEIIDLVRHEAVGLTVVTARSADIASQMDVMVFATAETSEIGIHQDLLVSNPAYARIWEQRLQADNIDLTAIGIGDEAHRDLLARLVTERFKPGEAIYREGDAADRVIFIISGLVEITTGEDTGDRRRAAVLGPGNHCGDLRLTVGEKRAESAYAMDDTVVRSLSRDAVSAGMMGLLDRSPAERRIVTSILRDGPATPEELHARLPGMGSAEFRAALDVLHRDGAVRESNGEVHAVQKRTVKAGAADILDRLRDL